MSDWGSKNFKHLGLSPTVQNLEDVVAEFPSKLKQAMFSAASTKQIAQRTWNGCAFNAAGIEVGKQDEKPTNIRSVYEAAKTFGITPAKVSLFIAIWDRLQTSENPTQILRTALEKAGLFLEPGQRKPRIISVKVFESQQAKLREEFNSLMEANAVPDTDVAIDLLVSV